MSPPIVTDAICLTVQTFSETSKIAVLYTRLWGRISVIAKGANRPKSQFSGHLEPLSVAECVIYKKPTERLQLLASCRSTQPWLPLTTSLERAAYAFAVCEFLYRHTYEGQDGELFNLAAGTLESLAHLPDNQMARQFWSFLLSALEYLGFRPVFDHCDRCGRRPEEGKKVMFDTAEGKIICRNCRRDEGRPRIISPGALNELKTRQSQPILDDNEAPLPASVLDEIAASVSDFATYHLGGGRLRSLEFAYRMTATG